jgi:cellulose synthase/poly-beta-1,6-N-acetylglucosamine synthase-like glycosyltransferase
MTPAEIVFWGSLAVSLYACGIYPLFVWFVSRWARDNQVGNGVGDAESWPTVTLVISANRDEHFIVQRLQNAVSLDYPRGYLQIIVGCAGEGDLTTLLARSFDRRQIEVVQSTARSETYVLNACLRQARGEIVVFSNARTLMRADAVRRLARHFRNPAIGGVCGRLVVVDLGGGRFLDRRFSTFGNFIKRCEGRLGALPEVDRGLYAIRKELFVPANEETAVDSSAIAMEVYRRGYQLIYDEGAVATTEANPAAAKWPRLHAEVRHGLSLVWPVVDFPRGPISFFFWINKVVRSLCPAFLIAAFVSNAYLASDPFYLHCLLFHELFYVVAMTAFYVTSNGRHGRRRLPWQSPADAKERIGDPLSWISARPANAVASDVATRATP